MGVGVVVALEPPLSKIPGFSLSNGRLNREQGAHAPNILWSIVVFTSYKISVIKAVCSG
jgi:hypothetical protein